jgi:hypothetical protein
LEINFRKKKEIAQKPEVVSEDFACLGARREPDVGADRLSGVPPKRLST